MSGRKIPFEKGNYYHALNFGIDNRLVFNDKKDIDRFTALINYYRFKNPPARFAFKQREIYKNDAIQSPLVEIVSYSMMPNHFHLLLRQVEDQGVSQFMSKITNSYTRYFNARNKRSGPLFSGTFKSSQALTPDQTLQVSAFIHMEPVRRGIVIDVSRFPFSSFPEYTSPENTGFCTKDVVLKNFHGPNEYRQYIISYANRSEDISHVLLEQ